MLRHIWCGVLLLNPKAGYWTRGAKYRFIFLYWLIILIPKAVTHSIWHLSELLFNYWKKNPKESTEHHTPDCIHWEHISTSPFFITLYDDDTVAGIQKGFLVWNICNPFVGKITLLAALLKVFILPLESSSLCLRVLFLWCLKNSPLITICWHIHRVLRWQRVKGGSSWVIHAVMHMFVHVADHPSNGTPMSGQQKAGLHGLD